LRELEVSEVARAWDWREFPTALRCCALAIPVPTRGIYLFLRRGQFSLDRNVCARYIRAMKRISMFLSESQIVALKKVSKRTGLKVSELIRRFIDEALKKA
jgi:hypothetical protein